MPQPVLVFDVNETLLDLTALDPHFERHFGDTGVRAEWFQQVLMAAFATTAMGVYHSFGHVARTALQLVARRHRVTLSDDLVQQIIGQMRRLPPHPDILPGITRLQEAGFRMVALTNSPSDVARAQVEYAELSPFLEDVLSVDGSQHLKPAEAVYAYASQVLETPPDALCLIAAHDWDIAGAMQVGWHGAFIHRGASTWNPIFPPPTFKSPDLAALADILIARTL